MGADNAEKQGQCTLFSLFPLSHLASTNGCYVTAIYTRAPFPSRPPSLPRVRRHHTKTKWSCSPSLLQDPFSLSLPHTLSQIWPDFCNSSRVKTVLANGKQQGRTGWMESEMSPRRDITLTAAWSRALVADTGA